MDLFWADKHAGIVLKKKKKLYTCAAGVTPSGPKHIGSFREVITSYFIAKAISDAGKNVRLIYSWDSYDRFRKVPSDVPDDKKELMKSMIGKPVSEVIDPWGCHNNWAEHWINKFENEVKLMGINAEYLYQHEKYKSCEYADNIKTALNNRETIMRILNKYRKEPLPLNWYPLHVYCEKCGKDSTTILDYDGNYSIKYECDCGHKGVVDFSKKGIVKLSWRVDWPMRWAYEGVDFEPGGKDHMVAGSSFDTGKQIVTEVFGAEPPYGIMYDYVGAKGGLSKMSASKGGVIFVSDALNVYLKEIILFLFAGTKPNKELRISFDEDVIKIYDDFFKCEQAFYDKISLSEKRLNNLKRIYEFCVDKPSKSMPAQLGFRTAALITQSRPKSEWLSAVSDLINFKKSDEERLLRELGCADFWVNNYAPSNYKIIVNKSVPKNIKLSSVVKKQLRKLGEELISNDLTIDEINQLIFTIARQGVVKEFFRSAYQVIISKDKGPRLAQFIKTVGSKRIGKLLISV